MKKVTCIFLAIIVGQVSYAELGDGVSFGSPAGDVTIHPYVNSQFGYDSNVFFDDGEEESDTFTLTQIGLIKERSEVGFIDFGGRAYYFIEDYHDFDELDEDDFSFDANVGINQELDGKLLGINNLKAKVDADFSDNEDVDQETGNLESTRRWGANLVLAYLLGKTGILGADVGYSEVSYDRDALFDREQVVYGVSLAPAVTDKTSALLRYERGEQSSDGFDSDEGYDKISAGLSSRRSDKTMIELTAGAIDHDLADSEQFSVDGRLIWAATDKNTVTATIATGAAPSSFSRNNVNFQTLSTLALNTQHSSKISTTLKGYFNDSELERADDPTTPEGAVKLSSETLGVSGKVNYRIQKYLSVYALLSYEDRDSSLPDNNYQEEIASVGVDIKL